METQVFPSEADEAMELATQGDPSKAKETMELPTQVDPSEAKETEEPETQLPDCASDGAENLATMDAYETAGHDPYETLELEIEESPATQKNESTSAAPEERQPVAVSGPTNVEEATPDMPKVIQPQVSEANARKRMSRMMRPRVDGSYVVPKEIVDLYNNAAKRPELEAEFIRCGLDKDCHADNGV